MDEPNNSLTKCPVCEDTQFEMVEDYPTNSKRTLSYLRCSSCKTFLQALPSEDPSKLINKILKYFKIS